MFAVAQRNRILLGVPSTIYSIEYPIGEAVHTFLDFHVDIPILYFGGQIFQVDELLRDKVGWYPHVLISIKGCTEINILDICTCIPRPRGANYTVPHYF